MTEEPNPLIQFSNALTARTTATVLAASIVREGAKAVAAGMNPMDLKRGVDLAVMRSPPPKSWLCSSTRPIPSSSKSPARSACSFMS